MRYIATTKGYSWGDENASCLDFIPAKQEAQVSVEALADYLKNTANENVACLIADTHNPATKHHLDGMFYRDRRYLGLLLMDSKQRWLLRFVWEHGKNPLDRLREIEMYEVIEMKTFIPLPFYLMSYFLMRHLISKKTVERFVISHPLSLWTPLGKEFLGNYSLITTEGKPLLDYPEKDYYKYYINGEEKKYVPPCMGCVDFVILIRKVGNFIWDDNNIPFLLSHYAGQRQNTRVWAFYRNIRSLQFHKGNEYVQLIYRGKNYNYLAFFGEHMTWLEWHRWNMSHDDLSWLRGYVMDIEGIKPYNAKSTSIDSATLDLMGADENYSFGDFVFPEIPEREDKVFMQEVKEATQTLLEMAEKNACFATQGRFSLVVGEDSPLSGLGVNTMRIIAYPDHLLGSFGKDNLHMIPVGWSPSRPVTTFPDPIVNMLLNFVFAALWHDLRVAVDEVFHSTKHDRRDKDNSEESLTDNAQKKKNKHGKKAGKILPRTRSSEYTIEGDVDWGTAEEREKIRRNIHAVSGFLRRLPAGWKNSDEARAIAQSYNIVLRPGTTFVRPHLRGKELENAEMENPIPIKAKGLSMLLSYAHWGE